MNLVASGWGAYAAWGESVPYFDYGSIMLGELPHKFLWAVKQKCVDMEQCNNVIKKLNFTIDDSLLCVVGPGSGGINGALFGDSGGPLTYTKNGVTTLYGVTSAVLFNIPDPTNLTMKTLAHESTFMRVSRHDILQWIIDFKEESKKD